MISAAELIVKERSVDLGDFSTRWFESGDGSHGQVLMLPSIGLGASAYGALRRALPPGWLVCSYVPRGHRTGPTETNFGLNHQVLDAVAALACMRDAPVHVVGHSMGGVVAALAAARAPHRVASIALVATPAAGSPVFAERATAVDRDGFQAVMEATLARWFAGECNGAEALPLVRQQLQNTSHQGFASLWRALASFADFSALGGTLPPLLSIAAAQDVSTPPSVMQRIHDDLQRGQPGAVARLEIVHGAGHMVPLTHPDAVASLLISHWARCVPS